MRHRQRSAHQEPQQKWNWRRILLVFGVIIAILVAIIGVFSPDKTPVVTNTAKERTGFPVIQTKNLSATQKRVLELARQEYRKNPSGYDKTVMTYTEGFRESWCADFISWIFYQADTPFIHPETKYWRIPGVQTLRAYYEQEDAYHEVGDGYTPKIGDVAFYFGETPDGGSAEHVAMILEVRGDKIVTIGGNETDGRIIQVRYDTLEANVKGLTAIGASGIK